MRVHWTGTKDETLACLAIFPFVGALLGLFTASSAANAITTTVIGASIGLLFWSLIAVQDLRITRTRRTARTN